MPAILAFEKISKRFGAVVVARELDLALAEGEALGIIGPNGAGKTTLFGIASGTVAPDAGRVVFAGMGITHLAPERRCRLGIGRSFQIPQPFNGMTVFENLVVAAAFGGGRRERDVYGRCVKLVEQCGLAAKANRPAGSLTLLDRKRLELARALATQPRVLLLDEVAGGLTEHECKALLDVRALDAFYGDFQALFGVSLRAQPGEVVAVIGANGAGKSTLLKCIAGVIASRRDAIVFDGEPIGDEPAHAVVARGIALVPEGRRLFPSLSVEENVLIGGQLGRAGPWSLPRIYELFPALAERRHVSSTSLSGGEQQMVAIGRALMSNPKLLLCDEISLGLAPIVVREVYARLPSIVAEGSSLVIVEQDIVQALKAANHVYCLQEGRIALAGAAATLTREAISAAYFGA